MDGSTSLVISKNKIKKIKTTWSSVCLIVRKGEEHLKYNWENKASKTSDASLLITSLSPSPSPLSPIYVIIKRFSIPHIIACVKIYHWNCKNFTKATKIQSYRGCFGFMTTQKLASCYFIWKFLYFVTIVGYGKMFNPCPITTSIWIFVKWILMHARCELKNNFSTRVLAIYSKGLMTPNKMETLLF